MLKKIVVIAFLLGFSSIFALSEGKEYLILGENERIDSANVEVIELLSYGCIHCYNHFKAGSLRAAANSMPNYKFEEWQVREMGEFGEQMTKILAYATMLDSKNGITTLDEKSTFHRILSSYFEATFKFRLKFSSESDFYSIALNIINEKAEPKIAVSDIENYALTGGASYIKRVSSAINVAKNSGTPAFVVNGKYLINIEYIDSVEDLVRVIKALSEMK